MGDAGERGPPGPDGNEVRTRARFLLSMSNTYLSLLSSSSNSGFFCLCCLIRSSTGGQCLIILSCKMYSYIRMNNPSFTESFLGFFVFRWHKYALLLYCFESETNVLTVFLWCSSTGPCWWDWHKWLSWSKGESVFFSSNMFCLI